MKAFWIGSVCAAILVAGQAAAAEQAAGSPTCVVRTRGEDDGSWMGRTKHYCEIRWSDLVAQSATGGWTHPHYIDVCTRQCRVGYFDASTPSGGAGLRTGEVVAAAAGVGAAIGIALATTGHGHETPASP
jgi:hypothetical protein